jgi:hypothetical protein
MNTQVYGLTHYSKLFASLRIHKPLYPLNLRKVISATNCPNGVIVCSGLNVSICKKPFDITVPGAIQISHSISQGIWFTPSNCQLCFPQADTATDIISNQVGIKPAIGTVCGTDGTAFTGMQIRQPHREAHPLQLGSLLKLLDSHTLNPISRRRDHTHLACLLYHLILSIR